MKHLSNHINHPHLRSDSTLYVIGVISNPVRYHSRLRIAREWMEHMKKTANVQLCLVETAFGDRHHEIAEEGNPWHLRLRTKSEIWIKENMINLAVKHLLPQNWRYMAWVDADVFFDDPNWALETIHQLQHNPVVQPWQDALDLGPHGTVLEHHKSFASLIARGMKRKKKPTDPYVFGHPGFAWACTRHFWENAGQLIDFAILGSADHHMATAMVGECTSSVNEMMVPEFKRRIMEWERRVYRVTHGHLGYVPGIIRHQFHGPKKRRYYCERWQILVQHQYCPLRDLMYDSQGVIQLANKPGLEQAIRRYNRSRFEDSIEEC